MSQSFGLSASCRIPLLTQKQSSTSRRLGLHMELRTDVTYQDARGPIFA